MKTMNDLDPWKHRKNPMLKGTDYYCRNSVLKVSEIFLKDSRGVNYVVNPFYFVSIRGEDKSLFGIHFEEKLKGTDFKRIENRDPYFDPFPYWEYKVNKNHKVFRVLIYDDSEEEKRTIEEELNDIRCDLLDLILYKIQL